jgi:DNA polymerase (family 10)
MNNRTVANHLKVISQLESLAGTQKFKVKAFQTASEAVADLSNSIEYYAENDILSSIPGVGTSAAVVIKEFINTGTSKRLENLSARVCPASVMEFTRVKGIGIKTAFSIWKESGFTNLADLAKSLTGPKSWISEKLRAAVLEEAEHETNRVLYEQAKALADYVVDNLRKVVDVVMICGSIRRKRPDSKDVDLVAIVSPQQRSELVKELSAIGTVNEFGEAKFGFTVEHNNTRMNVDLWLTTTDQFGAAILYATGSKEYCIKLRTLAASKGWRLNEKGLYNSDEICIASKTELDIVSALGLPWLEPENR